MRVHVDPQGKILGYYPDIEEIIYPTLPEPLIEITEQQYRAALDANHTHLDEAGNGYTPPPPPPPPNLSRLTLQERLSNLGFSQTEIELLTRGNA